MEPLRCDYGHACSDYTPRPPPHPHTCSFPPFSTIYTYSQSNQTLRISCASSERGNRGRLESDREDLAEETPSFPGSEPPFEDNTVSC
jgi:hypothetical protein